MAARLKTDMEIPLEEKSWEFFVILGRPFGACTCVYAGGRRATQSSFKIFYEARI
jgi:hypothetical protein